MAAVKCYSQKFGLVTWINENFLRCYNSIKFYNSIIAIYTKAKQFLGVIWGKTT